MHLPFGLIDPKNAALQGRKKKGGGGVNSQEKLPAGFQQL
jgi:hypothetical protein